MAPSGHCKLVVQSITSNAYLLHTRLTLISYRYRVPRVQYALHYAHGQEHIHCPMAQWCITPSSILHKEEEQILYV